MSHLILSRNGNAGTITLNRPEALNALSVEMVAEISDQLRAFADDDTVKLVLITSSSPRAFCAGGDVKQAVSIIEANPVDGADPYFSAEYGFDRLLATYQKPVVALVDGVVMGGGFGVARLARYMVVSSTIKMAMPETAIGLFPDVGASYFLRRAPLSVALMMGMTGTIIGAGDAMAWGIADYHCPSDRFADVANALGQASSEEEVVSCLASYNSSAPDGVLAPHKAAIDDVFGKQTPLAIAQAAEALAKTGAQTSWHEALSHRCPTSIAAFWHLMVKEDVPASSEAAILRDYFLACKMTRRADFKEGVRAILLEKDNAPKWSPASLSQIDDKMLDDLFDFTAMSPLPD